MFVFVFLLISHVSVTLFLRARLIRIISIIRTLWYVPLMSLLTGFHCTESFNWALFTMLSRRIQREDRGDMEPDYHEYKVRYFFYSTRHSPLRLSVTCLLCRSIIEASRPLLSEYWPLQGRLPKVRTGWRAGRVILKTKFLSFHEMYGETSCLRAVSLFRFREGSARAQPPPSVTRVVIFVSRAFRSTD